MVRHSRKTQLFSGELLATLTGSYQAVWGNVAGLQEYKYRSINQGISDRQG